ncbi:hypothetical protein D3C80_1289090 [compost metagenome]
MGINAKPRIGKLGHVGFADHYRASLQQLRHHCSVVVGYRRIGQHPRTGSGGLPGDIKQVFDRYRHTVQCRQGLTRRTPSIGSQCLLLCPVAINMSKSACALPLWVGDLRQSGGGQLHSSEFATGQSGGSLR